MYTTARVTCTSIYTIVVKQALGGVGYEIIADTIFVADEQGCFETQRTKSKSTDCPDKSERPRVETNEIRGYG